MVYAAGKWPSQDAHFRTIDKIIAHVLTRFVNFVPQIGNWIKWYSHLKSIAENSHSSLPDLLPSCWIVFWVPKSNYPKHISFTFQISERQSSPWWLSWKSNAKSHKHPYNVSTCCSHILWGYLSEPHTALLSKIIFRKSLFTSISKAYHCRNIPLRSKY